MADAPIPLTAEEAGIVGATKAVDRLHARIAELESERDEWKQQHENLLEVRRQDLAALTARTATPSPPVAAPRVTLDFEQVGTAGPFLVVDGRVTVPTVTMLDLARMLKPTMDALQPQPQTAQPLTGAGEAATVPGGWKQAPYLPTEHMVEEGCRAWRGNSGMPLATQIAVVYGRMLITAPSTPTPPEVAP